METTKDKKPVGAKRIMPSGRRRNIYIDDADYFFLQQLGGDNASQGIRTAIEKLKKRDE